jgi:hypothetical protein
MGFFNGERHQRQIHCAEKKVKLNVSRPCADTSLNTRPNAALDSRHPARILI